MSSRNKSNDYEKPRRRDSRSRSRDRDFSRDNRHNRDRSERKDKRSGRWTDAPSMSRFSANPNSMDSEKSNSFNNPNNYPTKPTAAYGNGSNVNPNILFTLNDNTKIKRKIYIPKVSGVNFVGLLIGPKGSYQKRLEQQSSCKILIRGKGTQKDGMPPQADDNEEQHVLIVGETEENVNRAKYLIEKVIYSDDNTRNKIKEEQLKASQEMRTELFLSVTDANGRPIPQEIEDYLMTPYGPPDRNARILPVPNDCVGLIIGKNGETIRRLHRETGCKIQIAKKEIPNTDVRNVFIEGPPEKYEIAKRLIEEIIAEQIFLKQNFSHMGEINPFPGPHTLLRIPNKMVGLIIGKNGETVKTIHQKTGCYIFIPKESRPGEDYRELELSGAPESVEICKREIISMIHMALYGRLPYQNSLFYPFIDPVTGLPIIDPNIMAQLDPNSKKKQDDSDSEITLGQTDMYGNPIPSDNSTVGNVSEKKEDNHKDVSNYDINYVNSPKKSENLKEGINHINDKQKKIPSIENLEYKYAPSNINNNYIPQQNYYHGYENYNYNLYDYNDQSNYDLYYQSLYQMYPQMSDYFKKAKENNVIPSQGMSQQSVPFVLFNTSLLEENNSVYDPSKINTNLLDVNFQNKIAISTDQYFEGKMFDQNYSLDEFDKNSIIQQQNSLSTINTNLDNDNSNSHQMDTQKSESNKENKEKNSLRRNEETFKNEKYDNTNGNKSELNSGKFEEPFQVPERNKRKSRFDK